MTINERKGSSHTPLYGISRGFAKTSRSTCRNICRHRGVRAETCRVRTEYALSTRKMGTRIWGPSPWMGVLIDEHFLGGHLCPQGNIALPLFVPYSLCTYHQAESIRTNRNHSFFIIIHQFWKESKSDLTIPAIFDSNAFARTEQFSIRIKIRAKSNYQTIFDSNENHSMDVS